MATPETGVRGREAPARSQEAPQGELLIPCELLLGLAPYGQAQRIGSPARKGVAGRLLHPPMCIAACVPEPVPDAGAPLQDRACAAVPQARERRGHRAQGALSSPMASGPEDPEIPWKNGDRAPSRPAPSPFLPGAKAAPGQELPSVNTGPRILLFGGPAGRPPLFSLSIALPPDRAYSPLEAGWVVCAHPGGAAAWKGLPWVLSQTFRMRKLEGLSTPPPPHPPNAVNLSQ